MRALPLPLRGLAAALGAAVDGLRLSHASSRAEPRRRRGAEKIAQRTAERIPSLDHPRSRLRLCQHGMQSHHWPRCTRYRLHSAFLCASAPLRFKCGPIDFHNRHARRQSAQQLVADRAGRSGDFVDGQSFAPQHDRRCRRPHLADRSDPRTAYPSTRAPASGCAFQPPAPACRWRRGADSRPHSRTPRRRCASGRRRGNVAP